MSELRDLILILYEYLYLTGNRLEDEYLRIIDQAYNTLFQHRAEKYIDSYEMLRLIETKARFEEFCKIQADIYKILSCYNNNNKNC